ncbi:MAG: lysophospholipid acyltransferase family protein [Bacteroidales bacterium]
METNYFQNDTYSTCLRGNYTSIISRVRRSRLIFTVKYIGIVIRTRRLAVKGRYFKKEWAQSSYDILKLLENAGAKFHIDGIDNIRNTTGPLVFICNHMSTLETMILPCIVAPIMDVTFVVKDSLVKHPLFGPVMRSRDPIVVSRKNSREDLQKVLDQGSEILRGGRSVIIFPQATRREVFDRAAFNTLGVKLAARNNVMVIPVALRTDFWKNGKLIKDLGPLDRSAPVMFSFGKPMRIEGNGKKEHSAIIDFITSNLVEWGCVVRDER